jgi:hypothetical protein
MNNTENEKETYPHLLFTKYIQTGKTLATILMVLAIVNVASRFFVPYSQYAYVLIAFIDTIDVLAFAALLFMFRYYLLNFSLKGVRAAIMVLILFTLAMFVIDRILLSIVTASPEQVAIWGDYSIEDITNHLFYMAKSIITWIIYIYMGAKLYRYKDDFVGGLQPMGQVCFIIVATGVITFTLSVLMNIFIGNSIIFPQTTALINIAAYIYLLYVMRFTFKSAQQYIEDSE